MARVIAFTTPASRLAAELGPDEVALIRWIAGGSQGDTPLVKDSPEGMDRINAVRCSRLGLIQYDEDDMMWAGPILTLLGQQVAAILGPAS